MKLFERCSMVKQLRILVLLGIFTLTTAALFGQSNSQPHENWVATWATAQEMVPTVQERPDLPADIKMPDFSAMKGGWKPPQIPKDVADQTVRMIVHTSIAGKRLRLELSNAFGKSIVSIGNAHVAIRTSESSIDTGSDRQLTFSGSPSVDIRPGAVIVSDPFNLVVRAASDLAVSLYIVKSEGTPTDHMPGLHTAYISKGDTAAAASMSEPTTTTAYLWLRSIDVAASANDFAIACLGDSITDGFGTATDANQAWPTLLAKRFSERKGGRQISVLNEGISGNQVLRDGAGVSALARFDRDVLSEPGVRWVVLLEGINDLNLHGQISAQGALVAEDLIKGYRQLIARAHMHNIKIVGATLTPEEGVWLSGPVGEATRQKLNQWIRTSGEFDAVVDFDAVIRDKDHPTRMREDFNPGDHIHPNNSGNAAMADAFNLAVFTD
jgi:lysophospholipase L1-like esterase